jgi:rhodanese-related sulfurtransferase/uncharacterized membrane protein YedE/YeeE
MSGIFPILPLGGGSPVTTMVLAGIVGAAFGFFLERAGFGSAKKITAVFTMRDWAVYQVMFTALITAMIGAQLLGALGWMNLGLLEVGTTYFWPMLVGGILFGFGLYFGGFCPGTAVVSAVRGRLDAWMFMLGIVLGIYGFAVFYDGAGQASWFRSFYEPAGATVMSLKDHPLAWVAAIAITIGVIVSFRYLYVLQQRFALRTPEQLAGDEPRPPLVRPRSGRSTKAAVGLAALFAVVLAASSAVATHPPELLALGTEVPTPVAVDGGTVPTIDALSLAEWIVSDAHRTAEETPPNAHVLDLRNEQERVAVPIRDAVVVPAADDQYEAVRAVLDGLLSTGDENKPLVVIDKDNSTSTIDLVTELRTQGINALLLDGGATAWQATVLNPDAEWPEWVVGESTTSPAVPTVASYQAQVRAWMIDDTAALPAYLAIPGTEQLPSKVATVVATGSGGGGCG